MKNIKRRKSKISVGTQGNFRASLIALRTSAHQQIAPLTCAVDTGNTSLQVQRCNNVAPCVDCRPTGEGRVKPPTSSVIRLQTVRYNFLQEYSAFKIAGS